MSPPGRARNLSPAPTTGPVVSGIRWLGAPRGFQGANSEQFWKWNHKNPKKRRYLMELEYFSQCKVAVSLLFAYVFLQSKWLHWAWSGLAIAVPFANKWSKDGALANTFNSRLLSKPTKSLCATGVGLGIRLNCEWCWFQKYCLGLVRGLQTSHLYTHNVYEVEYNANVM
jgi:hypothetical protein